MDIPSLRNARTAIQEQLAQVRSGKPLAEPAPSKSRIRRGERVIGAINSPLTRSLYSLMGDIIDLQRKISQQKPEGALASPERIQTCQEIRRERGLVQQLAEAIHSDFWFGVMLECPEAADPDSQNSMREGWQVVVEKRGEDLNSNLSSLLGVETPGEAVQALLAGDLSPEAVAKLPPQIQPLIATLRGLPQEIRTLLTENPDLLDGIGGGGPFGGGLFGGIEDGFPPGLGALLQGLPGGIPGFPGMAVRVLVRRRPGGE
jgi:hypothetical protein